MIELIVERALAAAVVLGALVYLVHRAWRRYKTLTSPRFVNKHCGPDCGCE